MIFRKIGAVNVEDLQATPNYNEAFDGSYVVFDIKNGMQLVLSCISEIAMLRQKKSGHWVTYRGRAAACERSSLLKLYFGGESNVETEAPPRLP